MKNAIYLSCFCDPWLRVAEELQREHGINPVYWVGFGPFDNSEELVHEKFPHAIYQYTIDGMRGKFPKEVAEWSYNYFVDIDFLRKYSSEQLQEMTMLNRLDFDQRSFNYMERERMYINLIKTWTAIIDKLNVEIVISVLEPHRIYDFVLYNLCRNLNIPYIILEHTAFPGRYITYNNTFKIGDAIKNDYEVFLQKTNLEEFIPNDILDRYKKVKSDYNAAIPQYMLTHDVQNKKTANILGTIITYLKNVKGNKLLGKFGILNVGANKYYKQKNKTIEDSYFTAWQFTRLKSKAAKIEDKLHKFYNTLTVEPDFSKPYVVVFLHYQPEDTTSPCANIFVNQKLCVEVLLKHLPDNYMIYVKEHPNQFMHHLQGSACRMKEFYTDLIKNPRVKLMPLSCNSFELIDHSRAITTCTGTVGWESMVRQRPVILFGISWYEDYSNGVLRITDEESAKKIQSFIENYKYDEHSLLAYLAATGKNTSIGYYCEAGLKKELNITESECVAGLKNSILKECHNILNNN